MAPLIAGRTLRSNKIKLTKTFHTEYCSKKKKRKNDVLSEESLTSSGGFLPRTEHHVCLFENKRLLPLTAPKPSLSPPQPTGNENSYLVNQQRRLDSREASASSRKDTAGYDSRACTGDSAGGRGRLASCSVKVYGRVGVFQGRLPLTQRGPSGGDGPRHQPGLGYEICMGHEEHMDHLSQYPPAQTLKRQTNKQKQDH